MGELSNTTIDGVSYDFKDAGAARQSHSHTKSQITDFPTSMPASDVSAWAKASTKPSYTQDEVSDGNTYKRVTSTEKTTWNNKGTYSKPSGGIPKTDLDSDLQTSLTGLYPPSELIGFKTLPRCAISGKETGGFAVYGPIVFINDLFKVPSGTRSLTLFNITWEPNSGYPELILPPIPDELYPEYKNERCILDLPVYADDGELLSDWYLRLYYNHSLNPTDLYAVYFASITCGTPPTSDKFIRLHLNYIGKKPPTT